MRAINRFVVLVLAFSVTACVTTKGGHTYIDGHCVTCLNNPLTGTALNYKKSDHPRKLAYQSLNYGSRQVDEKRYKGMVRFTVKRPVDTAYIRIKREFGFLTRDEKLNRMDGYSREWLQYEGSFRYEALPGVSYHMRHYLTHRYKGVNREHTIDAVIEKNGSASDVTLTYWVEIPPAEIKQYGNSLKKRALRAVR